MQPSSRIRCRRHDSVKGSFERTFGSHSPGAAAQCSDLPSRADTIAYLAALNKPSVADTLAYCRARGRVALQPRCGVGAHPDMAVMLSRLREESPADILTLTIDSHTRLGRFEEASRVLKANPRDLNGYPLVTHGWRRGRELNESVAVPLEIRHGSPDPRVLFEVALASGITSFEGGGVSYNLPYSKDVPLATSLNAWREVDAACGELADLGVIVDRELFGTLTAVLMPPSNSLAISVLEAVAAAAEGVRCISVSYPQGGNLVQDVAALRAIPLLVDRYLSAGVQTHAVLHEFMGVFPRVRSHADQLIFYGAVTARLGGASKLITKTHQEAFGIPSVDANVEGLRLADIANSDLLSFITVDEDAVAAELAQICREVDEIVSPVLAEPDLLAAIASAFGSGRLDIPFSASRHAHSKVIPRRDATGAIRYRNWGGLPLSDTSIAANDQLITADPRHAHDVDRLFHDLHSDIEYFPQLFGEDSPTLMLGPVGR